MWQYLKTYLIGTAGRQGRCTPPHRHVFGTEQPHPRRNVATAPESRNPILDRSVAWFKRSYMEAGVRRGCPNKAEVRVGRGQGNGPSSTSSRDTETEPSLTAQQLFVCPLCSRSVVGSHTATQFVLPRPRYCLSRSFPGGRSPGVVWPRHRVPFHSCRLTPCPCGWTEVSVSLLVCQRGAALGSQRPPQLPLYHGPLYLPASDGAQNPLTYSSAISQDFAFKAPRGLGRAHPGNSPILLAAN